MPKRWVYIYVLGDPRTNEIRYVGQTLYPATRLRQHINRNPKRSRVASWILSLKSASVFPFMELIDVVEGQQNGDVAESFWIDSLRTLGYQLTNLTSGGLSNWNLAEETRERLRIAQLGKKQGPRTTEQVERMRTMRPNFHHTDETKKKIGDVQRGKKRSKPMSERGRLNIALARTGKKYGPPSHAARLRRSIAMTGTVLSAETKEKVRLGAIEAWGKRRLHPVRPSLTIEERQRIAEEYALGGVRQDELATKYGVSRSTIGRIVKLH